MTVKSNFRCVVLTKKKKNITKRVSYLEFLFGEQKTQSVSVGHAVTDARVTPCST